MPCHAVVRGARASLPQARGARPPGSAAVWTRFSSPLPSPSRHRVGRGGEDGTVSTPQSDGCLSQGANTTQGPVRAADRLWGEPASNPYWRPARVSPSGGCCWPLCCRVILARQKSFQVSRALKASTLQSWPSTTASQRAMGHIFLQWP